MQISNVHHLNIEMYGEGMEIQFRHHRHLIRGVIVGLEEYEGTGKEKLGCDYSFYISKDGGTIDGQPLTGDYNVRDADEMRDHTCVYFIGETITDDDGSGRVYKGRVADFRLYPSDLHKIELTLEDASVNGRPVGTIRLTQMELYSFYDAVREGENTFSDADIQFSHHHRVDIAKVKDRRLYLNRVHIRGELVIVCSDKSGGVVELTDVTLEKGKPGGSSTDDRPAQLVIPYVPSLVEVQRNIFLTGEPVEPSLTLKRVSMYA